MNITPVVKQLLIINVIFFIGSLIVPSAHEIFALHYFESDKFRLWQPITHMFMHGGVAHIAFNMLALYSFGSALEHFWGGGKFIFFYISCGLGAAAFHMGIDYYQLHQLIGSMSDLGLSEATMHQVLNVDSRQGDFMIPKLFLDGMQPIMENAGKMNLVNEDNFGTLFEMSAKMQSTMVGASGAIYGLLVAFAFMFPNVELMMLFIPIPIKAKYFVPGLLCLDLYLGLTGKSIFGGDSGIAHFAHIGGALIGFLMMWYWKKNQFDRNRWN